LRLRKLIRADREPLKRKTLLLYPLLFAAVLYPGGLSAAQVEPTLCSDTETILFSCRSDKKIISVCASNLSADGGSVQYRFGPNGAPDIRLPPVVEDWRKSTQAAMLDLAGGGGGYIAFLKRPYRYVVFSAISGHWGTKDGVVIEKNSKLIAYFSCTEKPVSHIGPDLFHEGGFPEDRSDTFILP
jgi:hypothetical protein